MSILKTIWDNAYGLLVDDGRMAAGALIILAFTALLTNTIADERVRNLSGFVFLGLVCALILTNLYAAGRNAARKRVSATEQSSGQQPVLSEH
jgi:hypothetical protein